MATPGVHRGGAPLVHPAYLPQNQTRVELFQTFERFKAEMRTLTGPGSSLPPPVGYVRAWRVFCGVQVNGQMHFVCHVAEHFSTCKFYNSCDPNPDSPMLLWGEPFHIRQDSFDEIVNQFPADHAGHLPYQAAFHAEIRPSQGPVDETTFLHHLQGHIPRVFSGNFVLRQMTPHGQGTLSFRTAGIPIECWTHRARSDVIGSAFQQELTRPQPDQNLLQLYADFYNREMAIEEMDRQENVFRRQIRDVEQKITGLEAREVQHVQNARMPADIRERLLQETYQEKAMQIAINQQLWQQLTLLELRHLQALDEVRALQEHHFDQLPNSYREPTMQLAFDVPGVIYKQYDETGHIQTSQTQNRYDIDHLRFANKVHLPYVHLPIQ